MKTTLIFILVLAFLSILSTMVISQPALPSAPAQAPIDGGLGLLAAAGGTYAWKKLRDSKNSEDHDV